MWTSSTITVIFFITVLFSYYNCSRGFPTWTADSLDEHRKYYQGKLPLSFKFNLQTTRFTNKIFCMPLICLFLGLFYFFLFVCSFLCGKKRILNYYLHVFLITPFAMCIRLSARKRQFSFKESDFIVPQSLKFIMASSC